MVMKFHGNVRGEVRVSFLALVAWKPHIFMCGALKLSGTVRTNVRLNIAIAVLSGVFVRGVFVRGGSLNNWGCARTGCNN